MTLQSAGKDTVATAIYFKILKTRPDYSLAWNNLGVIYGSHGKIDSAVSAYHKAVEKRRDVPEAYANLIKLYCALEEFSMARQWFVKGLGYNPESELIKGMKAAIETAERAAAAQRVASNMKALPSK